MTHRKNLAPKRQRLLAFTLIEVMIAVAFLSIALTAIFASQAGAVRATHRARLTTMATLLARCKMAEVEADVAENGLPPNDTEGTDDCCEEGEIEGFTCEWKLERVPLTEALGDPEEGIDPGDGEEGETTFAGAGSAQDVLDGTAPGSGDVMGELALSYALPVLAPAIEAQVRRAVVTVLWKEGTAEREMPVSQYLVSNVTSQEVTEEITGEEAEEP